MKNRDTLLLLLVLTLVGLFLWQLIQNLNKAVETVSTKDKTSADQLSAKVDSISTSTADLQQQLNSVQSVEPVTPVDYLSSYQSSLQ